MPRPSRAPSWGRRGFRVSGRISADCLFPWGSGQEFACVLRSVAYGHPSPARRPGRPSASLGDHAPQGLLSPIADAVDKYITGKLNGEDFVKEIYYQGAVSYQEKETSAKVRLADGKVIVTVKNSDDEPQNIEIYTDGAYQRNLTMA